MAEVPNGLSLTPPHETSYVGWPWQNITPKPNHTGKFLIVVCVFVDM
jgi:hypothetical protein